VIYQSALESGLRPSLAQFIRGREILDARRSHPCPRSSEWNEHEHEHAQPPEGGFPFSGMSRSLSPPAPPPSPSFRNQDCLPRGAPAEYDARRNPEGESPFSLSLLYPNGMWGRRWCCVDDGDRAIPCVLNSISISSLISFPRSPSLSTSEFNADPCVTSRASSSASTIGWPG
jgi:hypothetical protein